MGSKVRLRATKEFYVDNYHRAHVKIVQTRISCQHIAFRLERWVQRQRNEDARRQAKKLVQWRERIKHEVLVIRRDLKRDGLSSCRLVLFSLATLETGLRQKLDGRIDGAYGPVPVQGGDQRLGVCHVLIQTQAMLFVRVLPRARDVRTRQTLGVGVKTEGLRQKDSWVRLRLLATVDGRRRKRRLKIRRRIYKFSGVMILILLENERRLRRRLRGADGQAREGRGDRVHDDAVYGGLLGRRKGLGSGLMSVELLIVIMTATPTGRGLQQRRRRLRRGPMARRGVG